MIHCRNVEEVFYKRNMFLWLLSAFKAGFINSAGFLISGKFVSHVTGFGTQVGMAIGHDQMMFGVELLIIPICFIAGSIISTSILEGHEGNGEIPPYYIVQGLITLLIGLIIFMGESLFFVESVVFDSNIKEEWVEFLLVGTLCLICGLKNSLVTWTTYGKIRVTHLTGIATDIGINFMRLFKADYKSSRFKEQRFVNIHRVLTLLLFSTGAFLSALLFPKFGYKTFAVVFAISMFMTIVSLYDRREKMTSQLSPTKAV